jgi:hypothetical protein
MKLEKIGEIKVDVMDTAEFYRFLKKFVKMDFSYFQTYMKEVLEDYRNRIYVKIRPKVLLFPYYRYSSTHAILMKAAGIKEDKWYEEVIKIENLSRYNIFLVNDFEDSEINDIWMQVEIEGYATVNRAAVRYLGLCVEFSDGWGYTSIANTMSYWDWDDDIEKLKNSLKTLKWANNRKYYTFATKKKGGVAEKINIIEDSLWTTLNFFYILYTGKYVKDKYSGILDPIANIFWNLGNTFEEMLEFITAMSIIMR